MTQNENLLVVGENVAAFGVAAALQSKGFRVRGVHAERNARVPFALVETVDRETGPRLERKKGEWVPLSGEPAESWPRAVCARSPLRKSLDRAGFGALAEGIESVFDLVGRVESLNVDEKRVVLSDGTSVGFEALIWCRSFSELRKALGGQVQVKGGRGAGRNLFALGLELKLQKPLLESDGTYVFPFRFKDKRITALGVAGDGSDWVFSLDDEIAVDAEEAAKVMRTFKRELWKEFPELTETFQSERIVQFTPLFVEEPWSLASLEVAPGIFHVGTDARVGEGDSRGFALLTEQIEWIEQTLSSRASAGQAEPLSC